MEENFLALMLFRWGLSVAAFGLALTALWVALVKKVLISRKLEDEVRDLSVLVAQAEAEFTKVDEKIRSHISRHNRGEGSNKNKSAKIPQLPIDSVAECGIVGYDENGKPIYGYPSESEVTNGTL